MSARPISLCDGAKALFDRIGMPMNIARYETNDQLVKAVLRAYFAGKTDAQIEISPSTPIEERR